MPEHRGWFAGRVFIGSARGLPRVTRGAGFTAGKRSFLAGTAAAFAAMEPEAAWAGRARRRRAGGGTFRVDANGDFTEGTQPSCLGGVTSLEMLDLSGCTGV